jgi:hypothetical protein
MVRAQDIINYADQWRKVFKEFKNAKDDDVDEIYNKHPVVTDKFPRSNPKPPAANGDPLNPSVLELLRKETGLGDRDAWHNVFWLVAKSEHNVEERSKAFDSDKKGVSLFQYAEALSYDWKVRGVTIGLVGFTTHHEGKNVGDAQKLFSMYKGMGGEDLAPLSKDCAKDKAACDALVKKIRSLSNDPRWVEAQWRALCVDGGYIRETVKAWRAVGVEKPSALAIATLFDCNLNQGADWKLGGSTNLKRLGVSGNESESLKKFNAWRRTVAGTNNFNNPAVNGHNRSDQFEKLRVAGCFSLKGCDAKIKEAISWTMK